MSGQAPFELLGKVSVESGQIVICDPCYVRSHSEWGVTIHGFGGGDGEYEVWGSIHPDGVLREVRIVCEPEE